MSASWRCVARLYNTALEQRKIAYERCGVSLSRYEQEAELKDIRAAFQSTPRIHSHVLQDVLARLDKTFQAFFRRMQGGRSRAIPDSMGATRFHSLHLQRVRQRRTTRQRLPGPVQDRAHRRALVPPLGRHAQDGHDQP